MKRKNASNKTIFKYEISECPVCMEEMNIDNRSVTSPCMHEFCLECIGKWLTESSSSLCPLCKQSVKIIIYNIKTPKKYSKISFPSGFHNAWMLRNKTKNILDNFENILFKIFNVIRNFLFGKKNFDSKILDYLFYFGPLLHRPKSSSTNAYLVPIDISQNEDCWLKVEKVVQNRLLWLFSYSQASKIIKEINNTKCNTYNKIIEVLKKYLDETRLERLKLEIVTFIQMSHDPSSYLEFYVPGRHEHIIYTKDSMHDESTTAAVITRILTSMSLEAPNIMITGYQISSINNIYGLLEYISSYENILSHLSFASHYILLSTGFYSSNILKKADSVISHISISTCDFIRHCFRDEELDHISQTLMKFEERLIFFEPLLVDDSNFSELESGGSECHPYIFIELSDSDEDELEIISVSQPFFDLTGNMNSDDDEEVIISTEDLQPIKKKSRIRDPDIIDLSDKKYVYSCESDLPQCSSTHQATSSTQVVITNADSIYAVSVNSNESESPFHNINCLSDDGDEEGFNNNEDNNNNVDFIYQPRSVNDFYEYLMSKNLPDDI